MPTVVTHELPAIGTIWSYRKHPLRLYQIVSLANVAHQHPDHPPTVVYRATAHPTHVYTRTVAEFHRDFASLQSSTLAALVPQCNQSRCANALRSILAAGKPNLAHPQYQALLEEGGSALAALDASGTDAPSV